MPDYSNNFNNMNMALLSNKNNATTRSGFGIGGATLNFQNSALNFAGNAQSLAASVNDIFSAEQDVINQNMNLMRGNHYVPGYERVPIPPLPPIDPFSPSNVLADFLPPEAQDILGMSQDIRNQPMVDFDMENYKYSLDKSKDTTDYYYEDPLLVSFDLLFDRVSSPLFNGEVDKFFEVYATNDFLNKSWMHYTKFIQLFFKIFNGFGVPKYIPNGMVIGDEEKTIQNSTIPDSLGDMKRNKVWYINSISGLDKITAKMVKYEEDKITITLSEDIAMLVNYMIDCYNIFAYNYTEQRFNIPDNLLRFKMMIRIADLRTMKLTNHFEIPDYIYDKATEIYTLYDCNFDFFNSKNFNDEIINGGYGVTAQNNPSTVKFDISYKSIKKEFRTPLLKGEKNNIIDNKEIQGNKSMNEIFKGYLVRREDDELTAKDILSGAFGALTTLNNMIRNYAPKFQPNLPILPPDILGSVYDNSILPPSGDNVGTLSNGDLGQDDPLIARQNLITSFANSMKEPPVRVLPSNIGKELGYDYYGDEKLGNRERRKLDLGYDYRNDGTPPTPDLGFISLFLRPPQTGPLGFSYENIGFLFGGNLGNAYQNTGNIFTGDLGNVYVNDGQPPVGDLGSVYVNDGQPPVGDLGYDYTNTGNRIPLTDITLFGQATVTRPPLGTLYTNLYELRNISLNNVYDNTVERQQVSMGELYSNLVEKGINELGTDFDNNVQKPVTPEMNNLYNNQTVERNVELNQLYGQTEKPETSDMGSVFNNTGERQPLTDITLFTGEEKPQSELGSVYVNEGQRNVPDLGTVFSGTQNPITPDLGVSFVNDSNKQNPELSTVYDNSSNVRNISPMEDLYSNSVEKNKTDLNLLYNNDVDKTSGLVDESVYSNSTEKKSVVDLGSDYSNKDEVHPQGLTGTENVYEKPIEKSNQDLGKDYENNLII